MKKILFCATFAALSLSGLASAGHYNHHFNQYQNTCNHHGSNTCRGYQKHQNTCHQTKQLNIIGTHQKDQSIIVWLKANGYQGEEVSLKCSPHNVYGKTKTAKIRVPNTYETKTSIGLTNLEKNTQYTCSISVENRCGGKTYTDPIQFQTAGTPVLRSTCGYQTNPYEQRRHQNYRNTQWNTVYSNAKPNYSQTSNCDTNKCHYYWE